jgi:pectinesterase
MTIITPWERSMLKINLSLLLFLAFAFASANAAAQSIQSQLAGKIDIVVATDNSGDYKKVQDAINAVPDNNAVRKVIFVKKGKYVEKIIVPYKKTNITLVGENVDSTSISFSDASLETIALNTFNSYTIRVDADDFAAMNITFENTATSAQAVALHTNGDRQTFLHCRIVGWQDAFFSNIRRRNYMKDCFCQGAVDYLFGFGTVLFDSCQINTVKTGGYMTAAATSENYKFGYVFMNCKLGSPTSVTSYYLGRPWFAHSHTVLYKCFENAAVNPAGWYAWSKREDTCYYREYKCTGPGAATSGRVVFGKQLTDQEAQSYVLDSIFSKSSFPQGVTADTFETNTILRRFLVSTTPNMEQIAQVFLKCGRDTFPPIPSDNWQPRVDTNSIYAVIKANTVKFMDSGKVDMTQKALMDHVENGAFFIQGIVHDRISITGLSGHSTNTTLTIYDVCGKSVLTSNFIIVSNRKNSVSCDVSRLKQGVYFYSIRVNGADARGKFEKM